MGKNKNGKNKNGKNNKKGGKNKSSSNPAAKKEVPCYCIIVMGFPGSGKSTLAKKFVQWGWVRINQDDLGSADECKKAIVKALKHDRSVVIDRCNVHPKERKMWFTFAKKQKENIETFLVWLDPGIDVCKQRVKDRKNHPTLPPERGDEVIDMFAKGFKPPEDWECKYEEIIHITNNEESKDFEKKFSSISVKLK